MGGVIGVIVAETVELAHEAARLVAIEYEELPAVVDMEEAIKANSFYDYYNHQLVAGPDVEEALKGEDVVVVEGEMKMVGQEHFYLETNCSLVIPGEGNTMEVHTSSQNTSKTQHFCAYVCGLPANHVVARMKRMGGGFGGKETRSVFIACTAAVAAQHLQRPVKINVERDVDMLITGQRHAFYVKYRAGATKDGKLVGLDAQVYSNGGWSLDLSIPVTDRALFHIDNCYRWPSLRARYESASGLIGEVWGGLGQRPVYSS